MSDVNLPTNSTNSNTPADSDRLSASQSVTEEVAAALTASGPRVRARVIEKLTEVELVKRTEMVESALNKLRTMRTDRGKIKPDQLGFANIGDKSPTSVFYSSAKKAEAEKLDKQILQMEEALAKALDEEDCDYGPLAKALSQNKQKDEKCEKEEE